MTIAARLNVRSVVALVVLAAIACMPTRSDALFSPASVSVWATLSPAPRSAGLLFVEVENSSAANVCIRPMTEFESEAEFPEMASYYWARDVETGEFVRWLTREGDAFVHRLVDFGEAEVTRLRPNSSALISIEIPRQQRIALRNLEWRISLLLFECESNIVSFDSSMEPSMEFSGTGRGLGHRVKLNVERHHLD